MSLAVLNLYSSLQVLYADITEIFINFVNKIEYEQLLNCDFCLQIACKYISDTLTIYREDIKSDVKVDFRFLVFMASKNPLKLWVYKPFSVRRGHK